MKLRIKGNSLRLRLTQSEVRQIAESKTLREEVHFGLHKYLAYSLEVFANDSIEAKFSDNEIRISLPKDQALEWAKSDGISLKAEQKIKGKNYLKILVEKDFKCLTTREDEDESDNFPHPAEHQLNC